MSDVTDEGANPYEQAYEDQDMINLTEDRIKRLQESRDAWIKERDEHIKQGEAIDPAGIGRYLLITEIKRGEKRTLNVDRLLAERAGVAIKIGTIPVMTATKHMVPAEREAMIQDADFRLAYKTTLGSLEDKIGKASTTKLCDVKVTETTTKRVEKMGNVR